MKKRRVKEQVTTEHLLLSVQLLPNLTERRIGGVGYWQGLSFSLFHFLNWGQGPLGPALLCWRKIANPG